MRDLQYAGPRRELEPMAMAIWTRDRREIA
jgi:hypothetical protein